MNGEENIEDEDDGESSFPNDRSTEGVGRGQNKFQDMLKSMIARIEFSNALAPISEYGRH